MSKKTYEYKTTVTIGDTNLLQNMYFLNYIKLQGIVRELFIKDSVTNFGEDFKTGLVLITGDAYCKYKKGYFLFDEVIVHMTTAWLKEKHVKLNFTLLGSDNTVHAEGFQTIFFFNHKKEKINIPANWRKAFEEILE